MFVDGHGVTLIYLFCLFVENKGLKNSTENSFGVTFIVYLFQRDAPLPPALMFSLF